MNQQCNGRVVRPGQTGEVTIKNLYHDDSIERHVMSVADTKKKKSSTILDPTNKVTYQILNVIIVPIFDRNEDVQIFTFRNVFASHCFATSLNLEFRVGYLGRIDGEVHVTGYSLLRGSLMRRSGCS
jgi:hypothetical protein